MAPKKQKNVMKVIETKEEWDKFYNDTENSKLCGLFLTWYIFIFV
jgi:hypothetical protein